MGTRGYWDTCGQLKRFENGWITLRVDADIFESEKIADTKISERGRGLKSAHDSVYIPGHVSSKFRDLCSDKLSDRIERLSYDLEK